jgi:hypothetical protein
VLAVLPSASAAQNDLFDCDDEDNDGGNRLRVMHALQLPPNFNVFPPGYDTVKSPLGKLSHAVIMQGMAVLRQIEAKLSSQAGPASLADLSSQFYTYIPHVSGWSAPPTIRDLEAVAAKVELLMCLLDVTVAVRKMEASEQCVVHPLDHVYSSLNCSIQPLDSGPLLSMLRNYMVYEILFLFFSFRFFSFRFFSFLFFSFRFFLFLFVSFRFFSFLLFSFLFLF